MSIPICKNHLSPILAFAYKNPSYLHNVYFNGQFEFLSRNQRINYAQSALIVLTRVEPLYTGRFRILFETWQNPKVYCPIAQLSYLTL